MTTVRTSFYDSHDDCTFQLHLTTVTRSMSQSSSAARGAAHLGQVSSFELAKPRKTAQSTRLRDEQA
jgi:hypothetical protein